ncbi:MAG TPA: 50S ribosomal protein L11 methyltransferase [Vicinamibacterales bacterium]|nr:50S ribosomal protein L11 methyltransferase [Vicinamibacterales bacterium]
MTAPALVLHFPPETSTEVRDLVSAALAAFEMTAIHETDEREWHAFFRSPEERDRAGLAVAAFCAARPLEVEDEDWARRSQEDLRAIAIGRVIVAPPWDVPAPGACGQAAIVIVIEPSMGFGTGHHATTRLCLRALQQLDLREKRVIDVGTGSGVLAIAAAKLGARDVIAFDNDPDALAAARGNVARNGVTLDVRAADLESETLPRADVVLANLTGALLRRQADRLARLAPRGHLVVSGFLDEEAHAVLAAFGPRAATDRADHEDGWSALTVRMREHSTIGD